MAIQTTLRGHADSSKYAYLMKQYEGLQDMHRGRTAEQTKSLPAAVYPNTKGTWAYDTVHRRLREEILKRVFEENAEHLKANPGSLQKIQELDREMRASLSTPLRKLLPSSTASSTCSAAGVTAPRLSSAVAAAAAAANGALSPREVIQGGTETAALTNGRDSEISERQHQGREGWRCYPTEVELADLHFWNDVVLEREDVPAGATWASAPWLVSELYFYRRIAEAFSHFENGYDFFGKQKRGSLAESTGLLLGYAEAARRLLKSSSSSKKQSETGRTLAEEAGAAREEGAKGARGGGCISAAKEEATTGEQAEELQCLATMQRDLRSALLASLNGNAADLSLWPVDYEADPEDHDTRSSSKPDVDPEDSSHILCDETSQFLADIVASREQKSRQRRGQEEEKQRQPQERQAAELSVPRKAGNAVAADRVESKAVHPRKTTAYFFLDNAGSELLSDLWLACTLIAHDVVEKVVFFTKQYPIFVSDALPADVEYTLQWVRQQATPEHPAAVRELAQLWESYVKEGKWEIKPHVYFSMPFEYSDMPAELYKELKENAAFVISKGDANYRRIMDKYPAVTCASVCSSTNASSSE